MKKYSKLLALFGCVFFALISCVDNDPDIEVIPSKDVDFYYNGQSINYVIKEEIKFTNTSVIGSRFEWSFGDGGISTEKNPVHKYEIPGTYTVELTVDGLYKAEKKILISDIIPIIYLSAETGLDNIIYNQTPVQYSLTVDNPEEVEEKYLWTFPKGTKGEGIDENGRSTLKDPKAIFNKFGTLPVTLQVTLGDKVLETILNKVRINYDKPAKTLYYAAKGGNIMAVKLVNEELPAGTNNPFDTGHKSGKHALTLQYSGDWLYVFDAGSKIGYVADPAGLGDGEIFVVSSDWKKRELVIENYNGDSYMDFFYGYIDEELGRLHFIDRRDGIRWINTTTRNAKFNIDEHTYWVRNERLGYYGRGISWGNVNGPAFKYNGLWHWAKNSTGRGLYRFTESDVDQLDAAPAAGAIMTLNSIRAVAVDPTENKIFFADSGNPMRISAAYLDTGRTFAFMESSALGDGEGGASEPLFVTGMAVDLEGGYLYYAYRGPVPEGNPDEFYELNPLAKSGIKRIKLADISGMCEDKVEYFIEGVEAYGLTIDNQSR